jgi:hypothetical protein
MKVALGEELSDFEDYPTFIPDWLEERLIKIYGKDYESLDIPREQLYENGILG